MKDRFFVVVQDHRLQHALLRWLLDTWCSKRYLLQFSSSKWFLRALDVLYSRKAIAIISSALNMIRKVTSVIWQIYFIFDTSCSSGHSESLKLCWKIISRVNKYSAQSIHQRRCDLSMTLSVVIYGNRKKFTGTKSG